MKKMIQSIMKITENSCISENEKEVLRSMLKKFAKKREINSRSSLIEIHENDDGFAYDDILR